MGKIREVYTYTATTFSTSIPLAAPSSSIGTILTNTSEIQNKVYPLYNTKAKSVGKFIVNRNFNYFENNDEGYVGNFVFLFDDGSYVMTLIWINTNNTLVPSNTKIVGKSISTSGKYADKEVTVTFKTDETLTRKVILEYEN
jgi:hypothetical protein